jgi:hypothetical protein
MLLIVLLAIKRVSKQAVQRQALPPTKSDVVIIRDGVPLTQQQVPGNIASGRHWGLALCI